MVLVACSRLQVSRHVAPVLLERLLTGPQIHLPDEGIVDYAEMCSTEGHVLIDKTRFVLPQFTYPRTRRLPVIRRPEGFGKTTFLSVLTTYFDIACRPAYFSSLPADDMPADMEDLDAVGRLMIMHLDFAEIRCKDGMSLDEIYDECKRFLAVVGERFVLKYANLLGEYSTPIGRGYHYQHGIVRQEFFFLGDVLTSSVALVVCGPASRVRSLPRHRQLHCTLFATAASTMGFLHRPHGYRPNSTRLGARPYLPGPRHWDRAGHTP